MTIYAECITKKSPVNAGDFFAMRIDHKIAISSI